MAWALSDSQAQVYELWNQRPQPLNPKFKTPTPNTLDPNPPNSGTLCDCTWLWHASLTLHSTAARACALVPWTLSSGVQGLEDVGLGFRVPGVGLT